MTCRLARTHPVPHGETDLQIQFHGENAPALPADRKGKSGRVSLRRQRGYPAASVADFSTAVLSLSLNFCFRRVAASRASRHGLPLMPPSRPLPDGNREVSGGWKASVPAQPFAQFGCSQTQRCGLCAGHLW
jgi:hypothetical protein